MDTMYTFLECPICLDLCNDPVEANCCHAIYCIKCAISIKRTCSLCKAKDFQFTKSVIAKRMIDSLPTECCFCLEKSTRGNLDNHLKKCSKKLYKCHFCNLEFNKYDYSAHIVFEHTKEYESVFEKFYNLFNVENEEIEKPIVNDKFTSIEIEKNTNGNMARLGETGKYYCGKKINDSKCQCCNMTCGDSNGCNCRSCMLLDIKNRNLPKGWLVNSKGFNARKGETGKFYCGRKVLNSLLTFSDGYCGPNNGPNCASCQSLDNTSLLRYNF